MTVEPQPGAGSCNGGGAGLTYYPHKARLLPLIGRLGPHFPRYLHSSLLTATGTRPHPPAAPPASQQMQFDLMVFLGLEI